MTIFDSPKLISYNLFFPLLYKQLEGNGKEVPIGHTFDNSVLSLSH